MDPLLLFLGSTETILPHARSYCICIALGAPFIMGSYVLNNILRYEGLAIKAMIGLVSGAVLNIVLDPILIFGFGMGTAGAGIATAFSQMVGFFILLSMFLRGVTQSRISISRYTRQPMDLWYIISIGFPSLIRQALASVATIILNRCAREYGDAAVAAMAIVSRISMFIFSIGLGFGQGFQPVCSFNYGAEKYHLVREAFRFTMKITMVFMGIAAIVIFGAAPILVRLFRNDPAVIDIGVKGLRYACMVMILQPITVLSNMTLQSTGKSLSASLLAMLRSGVFFIPILLLLNQWIGLEGIEMAQPIADVCTAITSIPFVVAFFKKLPK
jgi:putative MATE family efflux protein